MSEIAIRYVAPISPLDVSRGTQGVWNATMAVSQTL